MGDLYFPISKSRLKYWFQFILFVLMVIFIYQSVGLTYTILLVGFLTWNLYVFFKKTPKLYSLAWLDKNIWTFEYIDGVVTKEVCSILDHQLYFAFCFAKKEKWSTQIVWRDQLTGKDYKKMKILAKIYGKSLN
ncbi:hypothetical protein [Acinetobacter boissieri]|uniref:Toxin CptA n=1 Tax=Acinetobacter boissieri TaxID=1219383 RepID=A0A1G6HTB8_9GAMM|nr:hypothetical protein [Acinetobacter boissieri]SDB97539.1 hypothetical protein SAMN05421733_10724 [Acinetobacter boissieri]